MTQKTILRALAGETLPTPPIWMMRQAGRYLPEYKATRAQAGDFLSLCYNPELAAEVTLQPIRRYGFDAAILFADILLLPQALGADLWFVTGEGPRLSTITSAEELKALKPVDAIHDTLNPVYETVKILSRELPAETTLIGFAGAPWTVATYMIAGQGTPDQGPAHTLKDTNKEVFEALLDIITEGTIDYLSKQIEAGAEVVKIFDSWAGSLKGDDFLNYAVKPAAKITAALKALHPDTPVIAFPRGAGEKYVGLHAAIGADCIALAWRPFGDSGIEKWPGGSVIEQCTMSDRKIRSHTVLHKCMFRPKRFGPPSKHAMAIVEISLDMRLLDKSRECLFFGVLDICDALTVELLNPDIWPAHIRQNLNGEMLLEGRKSAGIAIEMGRQTLRTQDIYGLTDLFDGTHIASQKRVMGTNFGMDTRVAMFALTAGSVA